MRVGDIVARIDVRNLKGKIKDDAASVTFGISGKKQRIILTYQNTGFGKKRFFVCPYCVKNVQYLYVIETDLKCRECAGIKYTGIQNNTKGGYDEIAYRMKKYAAAHDIRFSFPFNYVEYALDKRMLRDKFRAYIIVLQALENMRFQAIMYNTTYSTKTIRRVIKGEHPLLQKCSLMDLKEYCYDWE